MQETHSAQGAARDWGGLPDHRTERFRGSRSLHRFPPPPARRGIPYRPSSTRSAAICLPVWIALDDGPFGPPTVPAGPGWQYVGRRDLATRTDGHDAPGMSAAITTLHLGEIGHQSKGIDLPPNREGGTVRHQGIVAKRICAESMHGRIRNCGAHRTSPALSTDLRGLRLSLDRDPCAEAKDYACADANREVLIHDK